MRNVDESCLFFYIAHFLRIITNLLKCKHPYKSINAVDDSYLKPLTLQHNYLPQLHYSPKSVEIK